MLFFFLVRFFWPVVPRTVVTLYVCVSHLFIPYTAGSGRATNAQSISGVASSAIVKVSRSCRQLAHAVLRGAYTSHSSRWVCTRLQTMDGLASKSGPRFVASKDSMRGVSLHAAPHASATRIG